MALAVADPLALAYIACLAAAMLIIGLGKAGFGVGVGIVVTPLIALVISPNPRVLAVAMPALLLGDFCGLLCHKRDYHKPLLRQLVPAGALGVVLGAIVFRLMQLRYADSQGTLNDIFGIAIGSACLAIVAVQALRLLAPSRLRLNALAIPDTPAVALFVGVFEAFLSTLTNSAGVLLALLLLRKKLSKQHFVTTVLIYFAVVNGGKIIAYTYFNHTMNLETLQVIAPFLPLVALGALLGYRLNHLISAKAFTLVLYTIAIATALRMIVRVVFE